LDCDDDRPCLNCIREDDNGAYCERGINDNPFEAQPQVAIGSYGAPSIGYNPSEGDNQPNLTSSPTLDSLLGFDSPDFGSYSPGMDYLNVSPSGRIRKFHEEMLTLEIAAQSPQPFNNMASSADNILNQTNTTGFENRGGVTMPASGHRQQGQAAAVPEIFGHQTIQESNEPFGDPMVYNANYNVPFNNQAELSLHLQQPTAPQEALNTNHDLSSVQTNVFDPNDQYGLDTLNSFLGSNSPEAAPKDGQDTVMDGMDIDDAPSLEPDNFPYGDDNNDWLASLQDPPTPAGGVALSSIPTFSIWELDNFDASRVGLQTDLFNRCTENRNYFKTNPPDRICGQPNAGHCSFITDDQNRTCQFCHDDQDRALYAVEAQTLAESKRFYGPECKARLDQARTLQDGYWGVQGLLIGQCWCINQLKNMHVCHHHRVDVRNRIDINLMLVQDDKAICGVCNNELADPNTAAWICRSCGNHVIETA